MRTQVAIIGAGPAGLLLGRLLELAGIDSVIIERRSASYVLGRIRAGVLEPGSVALLEQAGLGERVHREGLPHAGIEVCFEGETQRLDFEALTGHHVTVYGQTEVTRDLMAVREASGAPTIYEAEEVAISDFDTSHPTVTYRSGGAPQIVHCDFIAGCDGFHGVCRASIPAAAIRCFDRLFPFSWLGLLVDQPPVADELIYAHHRRGFALCSMRSPTRSRYYLQVDAGATLAQWPDQKFWDELRCRLHPAAADRIRTGTPLEKSIAPLRSFVAEPLRFGTLFLAGDAAHIVPPTGAKGLNLALHDVGTLAEGFAAFFLDGAASALDRYSDLVLRRVWRAERFSCWMTSLLHNFPEHGEFERRIQRAEFDYLAGSRAARQSLAENYTGMVQ